MKSSVHQIGLPLLVVLGAAASCEGSGVTLLLGEPCPFGQEVATNGDCVDEGQGCAGDEDCPSGQWCNEVNLCTSEPKPCTEDVECLEGEICSVRDRCVAEGNCFDNEDCRVEGEVCTPRSVCLPEGTCRQDGDCEEGHVCEKEECVIGGKCGETTVDVSVPPNLMILLDRSGSMDQEIDGVSKWEIAVDAVTNNIGSFDGNIRFGLALFSDCGRCEPGSVNVGCAADTVDDIIGTLSTAPRCSSTPIGASLNALLGESSIQDTSRDNAILLITDGQDTCDGDPSAEAAALLAQAIPVPTYVVGFGGGVDGGELTAIANAAGTALDADPVYYQADDAGDLAVALDDIAARVLGCTYPLDDTPAGPEHIHVFFNEEEEVERDATNGWEYDANSNSVTFFGESCDRIESGKVDDIDVVLSCPDVIG